MMQLPPQNLDAEESILAACLIDSSTLDTVTDVLLPMDFYHGKHQRIYRAVMELSQEGEPVDLITVVEHLRRAGELDKAGGATHVAKLTTDCPASVSVEHHAQIIKGLSVKRQMIAKLHALTARCFDDSVNAAELVEAAQSEIMGVEYGNTDSDYCSIGQATMEAVERLEEMGANGGGITGVPSGYAEIDSMTSGFQNSDLIIIAARPSMGKTALALNIADNAAKLGVPVGIFSLEMSRQQLTNRFLSRTAAVNGERFRSGKFCSGNWERIHQAADELYRRQIYINDTPDLSYLDIRRIGRKMKKEHGLGMIVVDYLQLASGDKAGNRTTEIGSISRGFKHIARELDIPVIVLSQLNRLLEQRTDKRPLLSDLRESGDIEQDADLVTFIYRDEVYNREEDNPNKGIAELIFAKNRNGPTGLVKLAWKKELTAFYDLAAGG